MADLYAQPSDLLRAGQSAGRAAEELRAQAQIVENAQLQGDVFGPALNYPLDPEHGLAKSPQECLNQGIRELALSVRRASEAYDDLSRRFLDSRSTYNWTDISTAGLVQGKEQ